MSGSIGPISSAVILPEPAGQSPPRKRRQSSVSNADLKRPRFSVDENADSTSFIVSPQNGNANPESSIATEDVKDREQASERRKSSVQEERKRGRRLFGGLLSTLSQSTPSGQQKRRQEIERRQAEKAKQQQDNDEAQRAEKVAKLKALRKSEQIKYNKESIRIRHSNTLARAHFLCTKTEPKLYYKPWELLPEEEDRIKSQITEVEALIQRELDEFDKLYPAERSQDAPADREKANCSPKETVGEPRTESPPISNVQRDTTNPHVQSDQMAAVKHSPEEHNGDVMVEAEEDTVIY